MAISTYQVYLMYKSATGSSAYEKLVDIKSFGDLGGSPEQLDTTTLSDKIKTSILGIQELDLLDFTANYTKEDFAKVKAVAGQDLPYAVWFGADSSGNPDGHDGKFSFNGMCAVYANGGGVNEVVDMTISIAASTEIVFEEA